MAGKPTIEKLTKQIKALEQEVNKLNQAERALGESEERYRRITDTITDYIYTVHVKDGCAVETIHRPGCVAVTGYTQQDFITNAYLWFDMVHDDNREAVRDHASRVLSGESFKPIEHQITRKDGVLRWVRNTPVPNYDNHGRLISYDGLIQDITELKRAQEMIRYKELFENVVDGVFILTLQGRFMEVNDTVYQKTGYSKNELLKVTLKDIIDSDQISYFSEMIERISEEKEVFMELNVNSKHGECILVEANCRLISYLGEDAILGVARDVTGAKLLQDQLIRSERLAATGQLAASIAHEINSPLQAVTALLNVINKTYKENEQLIKDIGIVKEAFENIRATVKKLLDLNRPGKERKQPVNVNRIIEDTVTLTRGYLKRNGIKIELNLSTRIPEIIASPQQLGQVFMNLINNAFEAMTVGSKEKAEAKRPATVGKITIDSYLRKGWVIIKIADTGPGIPSEDLKHIFDPFYTLKRSMGMGIGLSVCHGIIEDHKGTIGAKNSHKGGAVFTASLPVREFKSS